MYYLEPLLPNLPYVATAIAVVDFLIILFTIPWILTIKKEATSTMAWCLIVVLIPLFGFVLFVIFGYNHVDRPLRRKRRHRARFRASLPAGKTVDLTAKEEDPSPSATWQRLGQVARKLGAFPVSNGNEVTLYHDTQPAFTELLDAIQDARHHIHVEFFIIRSDETGRRLIDLLAEKAKEGVQVRVLYDAIGSRRLSGRFLRPMLQAGGKCFSFLPLAPLRRRIQVNLRNHRKIVVIDGRVAFTGGMNIGDEYLGKSPTFGYWRDAFLRLDGPAVEGFQRIFIEDWDFASGETIPFDHADYFPAVPDAGTATVQVIESGPDQEINSIRELIFAAITQAKERLWISTPYIVPDSGIFDALRMAGRFGVDVRLLWILRPDHYLPFFAARYYLPDLLAHGVKVYQYTKGMMHAKMMMVDGEWGWVGSSNLDNRSLHLNFEANCIFHSPELVAQIEEAFRNDLKDAIRVEGRAFAGRPFASRLVENGCRLLSPLL